MVFADEKAKENFIDPISAMDPQIIVKGNTYCIKVFLLEQTPPVLASLLIEGVPLQRDNLTTFLSK